MRSVLHASDLTHTDAVRTITREEGPLALYKGAVPALMLCGQGAVQFAVYEWLKARVPKQHENVSVDDCKYHFSVQPWRYKDWDTQCSACVAFELN